MRVEKRLLTGLGVGGERADGYLPDLNEQFTKHHIDTPLRIAHFLAQVIHESRRMRVVVENMNYSAERLLEVFPKYFSAEEAAAYARKPEKIGSRVYGGRMGNGDEATGDGYRYRGRGLIQLTGKSNYRKFSAWIGDDVVREPDRVAKEYAVHSAVYYWTSNDLNELADLDDVKQVTKKINGGFNGLAERVALLDKAKGLLQVEAAQPALEGATHRVTATRLNLRSTPKVSPATVMGSLNQGTQVMRVAGADVPDWFTIRVVHEGRLMQGFAASRYLEPISEAGVTPPAPAETTVEFEIPAAHLAENRRDITRERDGGRAYPLGESGRPRRSGASSSAKARQLIEIVNYLDSEKRAHQRYWPQGGTTYCNIYVYDYCYLSGAYLPRVWWKEQALRQISQGGVVSVNYGGTVRELNANALHDWFGDYGSVFGWKRELAIDVLQAAANNGEICIIVAQRKDLNRSGHITAVVPEHDERQATRSGAGEVLRPLESQAGSKNHRFFVQDKAWWTDPRFQSFAFWRHA